MEPKIIEQFSKETGNVVRKCVFFISETHPFLGASPDGLTEKGCLVEVRKVTSKDDYSVGSAHNHILLFQMVFS